MSHLSDVNTVIINQIYNFHFLVILKSNILLSWFCSITICLTMHFCILCLWYKVSGRSSAYGDTAVEGHPAGPGSISSSTGAISTTTAQQEGEGSDGEGETEGDIHTSNRSDITKMQGHYFIFSIESICLCEGKKIILKYRICFVFLGSTWFVFCYWSACSSTFLSFTM